MLGAGPQPPDLVLDDRLLELDFGPYEGWSEQELAADPLAVTRRRDGAEIPDVEQMATSRTSSLRPRTG